MFVQPKTPTYVFRQALLYAILVVTALLMLAPFYWMVSASFKSEQFIFASPPQWWPEPVTVEHYFDVFTRIPFPRYFLNSLNVAVVVTLGHVFFDTLGGYAFAKFRFPGRDAIFFMLLLGLMVPFQVNLIPVYRIMATFGLLNTYGALILPQITGVFGIFLMRQFMQS
ncbi:MAG: carbohydrate ABC transporter permease, partial [Chloroflexota bacterium]